MICILTCKLGDKSINCYDNSISKEQLKKWSTKKILRCPVCNEPYEYCHGEIKTPYFRHMEKSDCEDLYFEPETEEHLNGKLQLYNWIKQQPDVSDVILEGWLPETKQRPDVMFKYRGNQFVIEYQCSPISTEYLERHNLYKTVGIFDMWICGVEKYLQKNMRGKFIEEYAVGYYNPSKSSFIFNYSSSIAKFCNAFYKPKYVQLKFMRKSESFYISYTDNFTFYAGELVLHAIKKVDVDAAIIKHNYRKKERENRIDVIDKKINEKFNHYLYDYLNTHGIRYENYDLYISNFSSSVAHFYLELKRAINYCRMVELLNKYSSISNHWHFQISSHESVGGKYTICATLSVKNQFRKESLYGFVKFCSDGLNELIMDESKLKRLILPCMIRVKKRLLSRENDGQYRIIEINSKVN